MSIFKQVCVHYTGRLGSADGEVFDSSVGGKPFTFKIGAGAVISGCDVGVASMRVGERSEFVIEPHRAYVDTVAHADILVLSCFF